MHCNSLIKNFILFEDDAEIRLQTGRRYFYQFGFDNFYFEVLTYLTGATSIKTLEFTETNSYFYNFTNEKTYLAVSLSYQWVDFFLNLLADRKTVDSTTKHSLLA